MLGTRTYPIIGKQEFIYNL